MNEDENEIRVWDHKANDTAFRGTETEVCEYLLGINPRMGGMTILRPNKRPIGAAAWFFSGNRFTKTREDMVYRLVEAALSVCTDTVDEVKTEARSTTDAILKLFEYQ